MPLGWRVDGWVPQGGLVHGWVGGWMDELVVDSVSINDSVSQSL